MDIISIRDYVSQRGFVEACKTVRTNKNSYPYVTFINKENVAENIYFSKASSTHVTEGTAVTKDLFKGLMIGLVKNAAGEERIKLISLSERINLEELV